MTPEQLKASILQYAIQGKLVEQRPEEGTAEELYKEILKDKGDRLNGKKEGKLSSELFKEDEIPYDIPATWKWVRFGHIMINRDAERIPLSVSERQNLNKIYDYYGASGVIDKVDRYLFDETLLLIGEDGANLLSRSTPIAYLAKGQYWVNNHAHVLDCNKQLLCMEYIMYFINAISLAPYVTGTAQPKMNQEKMNSIPIALPPLEEQRRIVAKIEELLPFVDRYAASYEKLEQFNAKFPEDMKKSILQYAIQGKLVEQRPEEGTAEELYQQIQEEKQKLIKEGKIKKEKPLAEITEDEIPFDIPDSWKWVRMRDICTKIVDGDHNPPAGHNQPTEYIMLSATNINQNKIVELDKVRYVTKEIFEIENQRTNVEINDIFFTIVGSMGRSCVYKGGMNICFQRSVSVLSTLIYPEYLKYMLDTPYIQDFMYRNATGTAQKGFYLKQVENLVVTLPPLEEQHRIVAKIEELLPYCDQLIK